MDKLAQEPYDLVENAWHLKNLMVHNRLILVYSDRIASGTYEYLMSFAESKLDSHETNNKVKKKILNILVEALQNITRHGVKDDYNTVASLFVIGANSDKSFFVISGNTITKDSETILRKKLDHLNSLDQAGLKALYLDIIQHEEFSDKGGAGLGFLDIVRKSQSKLDYHFTPIDNAFSFFTFKVNVNENK